MPILSFGYGSNMMLRKVQVNVPSATKMSNATLAGYRFVFNKVSKDGSAKGNIILTNNPSDVVCGIVIQIADNEKKALDIEEGLGKGYNEETITVTFDDNQTREVAVYTAHPNHIQENLWPYDWYRDMVIYGGMENNLPEKYIQFLKLFPFTIDPDQERRLEKYSIINSK
jgi:gamma-glutamylcyclotransferase